MALTDSGNGMYMPVAPAYAGGNSGFGGWGGADGWWVILFLFALMGNGWGGGFGGFGGGYGNMMLGYDFPWLMNGQQNINTNTNNGFRDQMINDNITSVRDGISSLSTQLCGCCGDMQMALANGFSGIEQAANARQIASMQQAFASQTAISQGFSGVQSGIDNLKYTIASEECATRANDTQNTQNILNLVNSGIQSIKDQICQDKIDAKNDEIAQLRQEILFARGQASQIGQNATIIDGVYNRLSTCPVDTTPVYGRQPIFTCPQTVNGCGCGCGSF